MTVKDVLKKYSEVSLIKRIIVGMVLGVILALIMINVDHSASVFASIDSIIVLLGTLFVNALKAVAPILVFFLVISALANAKSAGNMKTIIVLYIISTVVAAVIAYIASVVFPLEVTLIQDPSVEQSSPEGIGSVLSNLVLSIMSNPVDALMNANFIGILAWAVALGIALRAASESVKNVFGNVADAMGKVVHWVIQLAPFGIMGLVYTSVSQNGMEIFIEYGQLIVALVLCMAAIALVTNPLIVFLYTRRNPYPLVFRCLKDSGITAFFMRSSAANIPVNLDLCEKLGLEKDTYSVSIPLGSTINMAGAAVTITMMSMTAAHTLGISVDPVTGVILCVLAAVSAAGASGVAGGSLLLIPLCCSLLGISADVSMQVVAIGFIIGVVQDSCETAINSSSDVLFTATADYRRQIKEGKEVHMGKDAPTPEDLAAEQEQALA